MNAVTIDFAFMDRYPIARLVLPSDPILSSSPSSLGYYKLRFDPIPTADLNKVENYLNTELYDAFSPYFYLNEQTG